MLKICWSRRTTQIINVWSSSKMTGGGGNSSTWEQYPKRELTLEKFSCFLPVSIVSSYSSLFFAGKYFPFIVRQIFQLLPNWGKSCPFHHYTVGNMYSTYLIPLKLSSSWIILTTAYREITLTMIFDIWLEIRFYYRRWRTWWAQVTRERIPTSIDTSSFTITLIYHALLVLLFMLYCK